MCQIYIVFIDVMENGEDDDILMKKKRKKNNEDTFLWDTEIYIYHSYLSIYHQYLFIRRANVLHECKAWELRVCGLKDISIQLDQFSEMNQLGSPWKVQIFHPGW